MKRIVTIMVAVSLAACATQEDTITQDIEQAVRDFIVVREMAETDRIRTANSDHWDVIDQNFIIYKKRHEAYLVEFARTCRELDQYPVVADVRNGNVIRARFDTIRGCQIAKMFPLAEGEIAELEAIGESPGSRN